MAKTGEKRLKKAQNNYMSKMTRKNGQKKRRKKNGSGSRQQQQTAAMAAADLVEDGQNEHLT